MIGVLLTLVVQAAVAAKQRRDDRQGRAFNLRFELYAELLHWLESIPELRKYAAKHMKDQQRTIDLMKEIAKANEQLAQLVSEIPDSGAISDLGPERRQDLRQKMETALQQKKESERALVAAERIVSESTKNSTKLRRRLDNSIDHVCRIRQKIIILSDPETLFAAVALFERVVANHEEPTAAEQGDFSRAVRRELGLDQRSRLTRLRDLAERVVRR